MYENNLQYHSIENFKGFKKFKIKKPKPISIKPITNPIKKTIIKPVSSGTVDLGNTIGSGIVGSGTVNEENNNEFVDEYNNEFGEEDNNEFGEEYNNSIDTELVLYNEDNNISTTFIIIIVVIILLILFGLYFLI